jgi:hypothetical protein
MVLSSSVGYDIPMTNGISRFRHHCKNKSFRQQLFFLNWILVNVVSARKATACPK